MVDRSSFVRRRFRADSGPPLVVLAIVSVALLVAGLILSTIIAGKTFPAPFAPTEDVQTYFRANATAVAVIAFSTFASGVPLAIYAATAWARLNVLGIRNPGPTIALAGGLVAAAFLCLSGTFSYALSRPQTVDEPAVVHALQALTFMTGGPGHVVLLGLLVAGIAAPGLLAGLLPRLIAVTGLVIAGVCELSAFALLLDDVVVVVPVGRFTALLWLIAAGAMLPSVATGRTPARVDEQELPRTTT